MTVLPSLKFSERSSRKLVRTAIAQVNQLLLSRLAARNQMFPDLCFSILELIEGSLLLYCCAFLLSTDELIFKKENDFSKL